MAALSGVQIIDADGHVWETDDELYEYLEPPHRGMQRFRTFSFFPSLDGFSRALLAPESDAETNAERWVDFLDWMGIAETVLYPTGGLAVGLIQDREWAVAVTRAYNNWLTDRYLRRSPRLRGVALLPVQEPSAAVTELERAANTPGMVAAMLPTVTATGKPYGDPFFEPIFAAAERMGMPLALHGGPSRGFGFDFFDNMVKSHALEHPFPLMIQFTSLVLDGVLERHPTIRWAFLEAGSGWLPYLMDRLDYEYESAWGPKQAKISRRPSQLVRECPVYVSCELDEAMLPDVIRHVGPDRVVYPSDYPHERSRAAFKRELEAFWRRTDLSEAEKVKILSANAQALYGLGREAAASGTG